jgi:hypothetical protein
MSLMKRTTSASLEGLAVLGKVGAGEHADGGRHSDAEEGQDQAADDGVGEPTALTPRAGHHLREYARR